MLSSTTRVCRPFRALLAVFAVTLCGPDTWAGATEWKVGLACVKITPEEPVQMSGYANRTKPFENVEQDLYVKAMVLEDRDGHRRVLVTSDLLGFPAAIAEPICERIEKKIGLKRAEILLNSAHTHAGPLLSLKVPAKDAPNFEQAMRTVENTRQLQDKVVEAVMQAANKLEPARLSWGSGVIHFVMNRREFTPTGVILGVNPRGLADRSVPVLRVDSPDGKPRAILFGAAVHNTTLGGDNYRICGDYAGFARNISRPSIPTCRQCSCSAAPATPTRIRAAPWNWPASMAAHSARKSVASSAAN